MHAFSVYCKSLNLSIIVYFKRLGSRHIHKEISYRRL